MEKTKWFWLKAPIGLLAAVTVMVGFIGIEYGIWLWGFSLDGAWHYIVPGILAMIHGGIVVALVVEP